MAKELKYDNEALLAVKAGVEKTTRLIKQTLGPVGKGVIIDKSWGAPSLSTDGSAIADEIQLKDSFENLGAELIKMASSKTGDDCGDGTTTAALLAEAIFTEGLKRISAGVDPMQLKRNLDKVALLVIDFIEEKSTHIKIDDTDTIKKIATVAARNDSEIGNTIADAMEKVEMHGNVVIEEGRGSLTEIKREEGLQFDRGYLSQYFVNNEDSLKVVLDKPYILLLEDKIDTPAKIVPVMEKVLPTKRPLLVIADDVESGALSAMVLNNAKDVIKNAAVKAPGFGDRRKELLTDLAIATGGELITKDLPTEPEKIELAQLGQAHKVIITKDDTTIYGGAGKKEEIKKRKEVIQRELQLSNSEYDKEKFMERLAKLSNGVVTIYVGAATETEMKKKKKLFESVYKAAKAAVEKGVLPGCGVPYIRASQMLVSAKQDKQLECARDILVNALRKPTEFILQNAGFDGYFEIEQILKKNKFSYGFDVLSAEFCDLNEKGIVDSSKSVISALKNAVSVAGIMLTTSCVLVEKKEDKKDKSKGKSLKNR